MVITVIPARNEVATIRGVVKGALKHGGVVVVDDASDDDTAWEANLEGANVLVNSVRGHIALSTQRGMKRALLLGAKVVVTMDAGGSHDPGQIPLLLGVKADLVIGRRARYKAPWKRRLLSWLGSEIANLAMQTNLSRVKDCTSGFRAYSERAAGLIADATLVSYSYDFQIEAMARCHEAAMTIREIPVKYEFGGSHLKARDVWRALSTCAKIHRGKL